MAKRTMYMHTLNDHPASYADGQCGPYIHYVGGRHRVRLVASLDQIRRERQATLRNPENQLGGVSTYANDRLGYVLVEVP